MNMIRSIYWLMVGISLSYSCYSIEFWRYTQNGDPTIAQSKACLGQPEDFSFNHLYCLAHQPYRNNIPLSMITDLASLLPLYSATTMTTIDLPWKHGFVPYVRKLMVTPEATVHVWSDIHGAAFPFFKALEQFHKIGILDAQFKITNPHVYFVFLGDYIDRGYRNVLTLYTILKLATENPDQVILLRGNHETTQPLGGNSFSLQEELYRIFGSNDFFTIIAPELEQFYDTLASGLFLGTQLPDGTIDYIQLNHAALELGMDVQDFLADPELSYYPLIIDRERAIAELVPTQHRALFDPIKGMAARSPAVLGLIWSDFCIEPFFFNAQEGNPRICYGQELARTIIDYQTRDLPHMISTIIHGHQHGPAPVGLLETLALNQGVVKSWRGSVYTINTSGETFGSHPNPLVDERLSYSSWLQIAATANPKHPWHIQHCKVVLTPTGNWQLIIQDPKEAPAGAIDFCDHC